MMEYSVNVFEDGGREGEGKVNRKEKETKKKVDHGCKTQDGCPFGKDKTTCPGGDRVGRYTQTPSSNLGPFL